MNTNIDIARNILSKNSFSESMRSFNNQEGGRNNLFDKDGIHYKSTASVDAINPHKDWAVYQIPVGCY